MNLRIPGPTPCPKEVLAAMSRSMINHRGKEFGDILLRTKERLQEVYQTPNDVLILTVSGTGALEAIVQNALSPGDQVLAVSIGSFGDRFAQIAQKFGAVVIKQEYEWGTAAEPERIEQVLRSNPDIKAVLVTHNETSTGVTNPLAEIAQVVKIYNKLILVDAISSLSSIPVLTAEWQLDFVASASQKGWMVPPGLAFVSISGEGWRACKASRIPRFYFDFLEAKKFGDKNQTPWTPAISQIFAMDKALEMILKEGLENVWTRHVRLGAFARGAIAEIGLELFADPEFASNTVTAFKLPPDINAEELREKLIRDYNVEFAEGQGKLKGKVLRVGHMGALGEKELAEAFHALVKALFEIHK